MADDKVMDVLHNDETSGCALESNGEDNGTTKGQIVHRFVNNFHIHQGGEGVKCGNCGAEKSCPRCDTAVGKRQCEICGIWISSKKVCVDSHARVHTGERPHKCDLCDMAFKQPGHLTQHRRIHIGDLPFMCDTCGEPFREQSTLNDHKRSMHSDERDFACRQCSKAFKLRRNLMKHYRQQHNIGYDCPDCGQKLPTRDEFTKHHIQHVKDKTASDSDAGYGNGANFGKDNEEAECSQKV